MLFDQSRAYSRAHRLDHRRALQQAYGLAALTCLVGLAINAEQSSGAAGVNVSCPSRTGLLPLATAFKMLRRLGAHVLRGDHAVARIGPGRRARDWRNA